MTPQRRENGLRGIELMTAWAGGGRSTDFFIERLKLMSDEARQDGDKEGIQGFGDAFLGIAELAGYMLIRLAQLTGVTEEEVLQRIARDYQ